MKVNVVASKTAKKNKEVAEVVKALKELVKQVGGEKELSVDAVHSTNRVTMIYNILNALGIGLSEETINNL